VIGQVYLIRCKTSKKAYIGITTLGISKRWYHHVRAARVFRGDRPRRFLEMAICKYGEEDFEISVLEECSSRSELVAAEIRWIATTGSFGAGYNMTLGGDGVSGIVVTAETRAKQSAIRTGRKNTAETRARIGAAHRGKKLSPEHVQQMRVRRTGCKLSDSAKAAISRPVIIDEIRYPGVHAAADALGVGVATINRRIASGYPGYFCLKPLIQRPKKSQSEVEQMRLRPSKSVIIDGITYPSMTAAAEDLGVTRPAIAYRIRVSKKLNYGMAS
jgi:group I intron endonuclease